MTAPLVSLIDADAIHAILREQADTERHRLVAEVVAGVLDAIEQRRAAPASSGADGMLTAATVAVRLGVHPRTLTRMWKGGEFPLPIRVGLGGRALRWRERDVDDFLQHSRAT